MIPYVDSLFSFPLTRQGPASREMGETLPIASRLRAVLLARSERLVCGNAPRTPSHTIAVFNDSH
jgi:hypothetical protein